MSARSRMLALSSVCLLVTTLSLAASSSRTASSYAQGLALTFQPNEGQAPARVRFIARENAFNLYLNNKESVLQFFPTANANGAVLRTSLLGSDPKASIEGEEIQQGKVNYLYGKSDARNITNVPTFARVRYHGVYRDIDLVYYGNQRHLEYDFNVAAGANPAAIQMQIAGADHISVAPSGELVLQTGNRTLRWLKPTAYQMIRGKKVTVESSYRVSANKVGFVIGAYDRTRALVIDPTLVYSTYIGGASGAADDPRGSYDDMTAVAVDSSGNAYVLGVTETFDYPTTPGAYSRFPGSTSEMCNPNFDAACPQSIVVSKINSSGNALLYSTYYKEDPNGNYEPGGITTLPAGIAVDSANRAYFAFSGSNIIPNAPCGCSFGELAVLNASGSAIDYSMTLGGQNPDGTGVAFNDVAVEGHIAYVTGFTNAVLPITGNAYQSTLKGPWDALVGKFDTTKAGDASILYLSYFGGSDQDSATGIAVANGNAFITGLTHSSDMPVTAGVYQPHFAGGGQYQEGHDAFVAKFNTNASGSASLVYSTYLGGSKEDDQASSIAIDGSGNSYITGLTYSSDFPTTAGAFSRTNSSESVFVSKLNSTASTLLMSTFLGGGLPTRIRVDGVHNIYVVGSTDDSSFPTTANAFRKTKPGGATLCGPDFTQMCSRDGFLSVFGHASGTLDYSTFLGGTTGWEIVHGLALTSTPSAVLVGETTSNNFPVTANAYQKTLHGDQDGFVMKFNFASSGGGGTSCSAPSTARTIHICSPTNGSTVSSPVKVSATAKPGSSTIQVMQVYVDGVKKYEKTSTNNISTSLSMSAGAHRVTVQAKDSAGYFRSTVNITVH
jgi:hypothetical protein